MKRYRINNVLIETFSSLFIMCGVTGCIKNDLDESSKPFSFIVKAYGVDEAELTTPQVDDVTLYIFDKNNRFIEQTKTKLNTRVEIKAPGEDKLFAVAWGNLGKNNKTVPLFSTKENISKGSIQLIEANTTTDANSPGDIFLGNVTVIRTKQQEDRNIPIYRKTGSMTITIFNLKEYTKAMDDDFSVTVSDTYNTIDFYGQLSGDRVSYNPEGSFSPYSDRGNDQFIVPVFNIVPELTGVTIRIYHKKELIAEVSAYDGVYPIAIREGLLTNVLIDFRKGLNISASETPWGILHIWKQFN